MDVFMLIHPFGDFSSRALVAYGSAGLLRSMAIVIMFVFLIIFKRFLLKEHFLIFFYDEPETPYFLAHCIHTFFERINFSVKAAILRNYL